MTEKLVKGSLKADDFFTVQILPRLLGAISNSVWVEAIVASRCCFEPAQISRNCYLKTLVFKSDALYACKDVATKSYEKSFEETGPYLQIILNQHDRPRSFSAELLTKLREKKTSLPRFWFWAGFLLSGCRPTRSHKLPVSCIRWQPATWLQLHSLSVIFPP